MDSHVSSLYSIQGEIFQILLFWLRISILTREPPVLKPLLSTTFKLYHISKHLNQFTMQSLLSILQDGNIVRT